MIRYVELDGASLHVQSSVSTLRESFPFRGIFKLRREEKGRQGKTTKKKLENNYFFLIESANFFLQLTYQSVTVIVVDMEIATQTSIVFRYTLPIY